MQLADLAGRDVGALAVDPAQLHALDRDADRGGLRRSPTDACTFEPMLWCVSSAPFGRPVVPDV